MLTRLRSLALGITLIVAASVILVMTDHSGESDARSTADGMPAVPLPLVAVITYNQTPNFEDSYRGFVDEMRHLGYRDGVNCRIVLHDAQFDIGTLNTIVAAVASEKPAVVVPFTTPALQSVLRTIKDRPVVFSLVASGVAAGAGTSNSNHLSNVTGAQITLDWPLMLKVAKAVMPNLKRAGTTFAPGETNSVHFRDQWQAVLAEDGIELISIGADKPIELPEAADALVSRGIPVFLQISDNAASTGFAAITKSATRGKIPVFTFTPGGMRAGATLAVARDMAEVGANSARIVDRILRGEDPAVIPFTDPVISTILINPRLMALYNLTLPPELAKDAVIMESADADGESVKASGGANPSSENPK